LNFELYKLKNIPKINVKRDIKKRVHSFEFNQQTTFYVEVKWI